MKKWYSRPFLHIENFKSLVREREYIHGSKDSTLLRYQFPPKLSYKFVAKTQQYFSYIINKLILQLIFKCK